MKMGHIIFDFFFYKLGPNVGGFDFTINGLDFDVDPLTFKLQKFSSFYERD
jgi:hypothetical protein